MAHAHNHAHNHGDHDHGGGHGHSHSHAPAAFGTAFAIGIALNSGFVVIEALYGVLGHSVALLADAGHNLGDVLGLLVAWIASVLARRPPTARYTYGLKGSSILAALFNAVFLLVTVGAISWEALQRIVRPEAVSGQAVMIVAGLGILINGATAYLFASGRRGDLNVRAAFLHMASDALVSAGVVLAGLIILLTGWLWLDPVVSLAINAIIIWGTWGLLTESVAMSMAAVPSEVDEGAVRQLLESQPRVSAIHDLHIWSMSTTEVALTCHLVMPQGHPGDRFIHELSAALRQRFRINHATVQIEIEEDCLCALAPDEVV